MIASIMRSTLISYLLLLVVFPIGAVYVEGFSDGWHTFWSKAHEGAVVEAIKLTVKLSLITAFIQAVVGAMIAYTLVRFSFPGRRLLNSLIDLPFALPTAVSGVILLTMFSPNGPIGALLARNGIELLYNEYAILIGMIFVTFPFVIRAIQPLLEQLDPFEEEASASLGAGRMRTFRRIVLPVMMPGLLSGSMLAFSRALAEFGVIAIVSGNLPKQTLVASVQIYSEIENDDPVGAAALSIIMLTLSFLTLWMVHAAARRKEGANE
ncbi:sulfate ABC transporter permease subunit CysT [Paenibacillus sp. HB172176]|uniref:sulfate ABC transporter permease subunit CysT n=1 Tax=Paenibacillus sp. HB172176 TaxID=2493690 RepID=UPI00143B75D5|nr:sulfate ABC transporter permease subunit CysT [Paenibacillus sp. HB172176]